MTYTESGLDIPTISRWLFAHPNNGSSSSSELQTGLPLLLGLQADLGIVAEWSLRGRHDIQVPEPEPLNLALDLMPLIVCP